MRVLERGTTNGPHHVRVSIREEGLVLVGFNRAGVNREERLV